MSGKSLSALIVIFLALSVSLGHCKLGVYNWQSLEGADTTDLDISYSIANYGFAPYLPL